MSNSPRARRAALAALSICLGLASAPAAHAASVTAKYDPGGPGKGQTSFYGIAYAAGDGERNDVDLRLDGDELVLSDAGAPLTAKGLCTQIDTHAARCPRILGTVGSGPGQISAYLTVTLGAGDDTLEGTAGHDLLVPGPGADTVAAAGGDDLVFADDSGSSSASADGGADRIDGGPGTDTVSFDFGPAAQGVTVDLVAGEAHGAAEGYDVVSGFEGAVGGGGPDVLIGTDGHNRLSGGNGRDRLVGGAGDDRLAGGRGDDVLDGGAGDDLFVAGVEYGRGDPTAHDHFTCGAGVDAVKFTARRDIVDADCESLDNTRYPDDALGEPFVPRPRRAAHGHRLVWSVPCPSRRCRMKIRVAVRIAGKIVFLAQGTRTGSRRVRVVVRLDGRALRLLRAAGGQAQVTVELGDRFGYAFTTTLTRGS